GVAAVAVVLLVFGLVAGDAKLRGVDHDDEVAGVDVRREFGLVLAPQAQGDLGGQPTEHLVAGVDDEPVALDLVRLGGKRLHDSLLRRGARKALNSSRIREWASKARFMPAPALDRRNSKKSPDAEVRA